MTSRPLSPTLAFKRQSMSAAAIPARVSRLLIGALITLCCTGVAAAQEQPVTLSPEGMRATAADIALDAVGTAWVLWVEKRRAHPRGRPRLC